MAPLRLYLQHVEFPESLPVYIESTQAQIQQDQKTSEASEPSKENAQSICPGPGWPGL